MAHTPGPWHWTDNTHELSEYLADDKDRVVLDAVWSEIPEIRVEPDDARLIAAAPDLLDACARARPFILSNDFDRKQCEHVFKIVVAAIAKATGEPT